VPPRQERHAATGLSGAKHGPRPDDDRTLMPLAA
jgi:hypothetical protein